jgi:hypothetical protein
VTRFRGVPGNSFGCGAFSVSFTRRILRGLICRARKYARKILLASLAEQIFSNEFLGIGGKRADVFTACA